MTRVDFYVLPDVDEHARHRFACRLAHRAWCNGQAVLVRTASGQASAELDELMWAYPEDRFLPHALATAPDGAQAPVRIGHGMPAQGEPEEAAGATEEQVLINLGDDVPGFFARFERVAEVVAQPQRKQARERYRFYRERGYPLFHHELEDWEGR